MLGVGVRASDSYKSTLMCTAFNTILEHLQDRCLMQIKLTITFHYMSPQNEKQVMCVCVCV